MFSTLFSSIGLHICGLFFLIFITFIYFRHKPKKSYSTTSYKILIISTFLATIFEIGAYYAVEYSQIELSIVLARFFILFCFCWFCSFCTYLCSKFLFKDLDTNKKKSKIVSLICISIGIIFYIVTFFFEINFHGSWSDKSLYVLSGDGVFVMYIAVLLAFILLMYILIVKFKELDTIQKISLVFIQVSYALLVLFQYAADYDFSDMPYVFSIYVVTFYFTIEGTDYKAIKALNKSKKEAEIISNDIYSYFHDLNINTISPLNNMYSLTNSLKNGNYTIEDIKEYMNVLNSEKVKIINGLNTNIYHKEGDK